MIDDDVIKNGGRTQADGISYDGEGLAGGKCPSRSSERYQAVVMCASITTAGAVFIGKFVVGKPISFIS